MCRAQFRKRLNRLGLSFPPCHTTDEVWNVSVLESLPDVSWLWLPWQQVNRQTPGHGTVHWGGANGWLNWKLRDSNANVDTASHPPQHPGSLFSGLRDLHFLKSLTFYKFNLLIRLRANELICLKWKEAFLPEVKKQVWVQQLLFPPQLPTL